MILEEELRIEDGCVEIGPPNHRARFPRKWLKFEDFKELAVLYDSFSDEIAAKLHAHNFGLRDSGSEDYSNYERVRNDILPLCEDDKELKNKVSRYLRIKSGGK